MKTQTEKNSIAIKKTGFNWKAHISLILVSTAAIFGIAQGD